MGACQILTGQVHRSSHQTANGSRKHRLKLLIWHSQTESCSTTLGCSEPGDLSLSHGRILILEWVNSNTSSSKRLELTFRCECMEENRLCILLRENAVGIVTIINSSRYYYYMTTSHVGSHYRLQKWIQGYRPCPAGTKPFLACSPNVPLSALVHGRSAPSTADNPRPLTTDFSESRDFRLYLWRPRWRRRR